MSTTYLGHHRFLLVVVVAGLAKEPAFAFGAFDRLRDRALGKRVTTRTTESWMLFKVNVNLDIVQSSN